jgi:hypothetical protein
MSMEAARLQTPCKQQPSEGYKTPTAYPRASALPGPTPGWTLPVASECAAGAVQLTPEHPSAQAHGSS